MVDSAELAHKRHTILQEHEHLINELKARETPGQLALFLGKPPSSDEATQWRTRFAKTMQTTYLYCVGSENQHLLQALPLVKYHEDTDFSLCPRSLIVDLERQSEVLKNHHAASTTTVIDGIGHRLKLARKRKGAKQHEVAQLLGCSESNLCRIESGRQKPDARQSAIIENYING